MAKLFTTPNMSEEKMLSLLKNISDIVAGSKGFVTI
jgi:hypothetical protein